MMDGWIDEKLEVDSWYESNSSADLGLSFANIIVLTLKKIIILIAVHKMENENNKTTHWKYTMNSSKA